MTHQKDRIVWIDLEMTGLDPRSCEIVEIATLVTDDELNVIAEGPDLVIRPSDEALATMGDFVREMHQKSGLLAKIMASAMTLSEAEAETLAFLREHTSPGVSPLGGNSVWKDRQFLEAYMPALSSHLHYRLIDVSTLKELARRWYPTAPPVPKKQELHRASLDIRESLEELKHYRAHLFRA